VSNDLLDFQKRGRSFGSAFLIAIITQVLVY